MSSLGRLASDELVRLTEAGGAETYDELADGMKKHGFKDETKASIANKLSRGSRLTAWFLAALVAIGVEVVKLKDI